MNPDTNDQHSAGATMPRVDSGCASGNMLLLGHGLLSPILTRNCPRRPVSKLLIEEGLSEWKNCNH